MPRRRTPRPFALRRSRPYAARAFSLLELLMVIALLGLIAFVAFPDFQDASRSDRLEESARRFESLLAMCRAEAMNESRTYRIEVNNDGSLWTTAQVDPLTRPSAYEKVKAPWALTEVLLDEVWVEAVQPLPEGPPPIRIVDEKLEFPKVEAELTKVEELETPAALEFTPDGKTRSARWLLRHADGGGLMLTLDGRLGKLNIESVDKLALSDVKRPEPVDQDKLTERLAKPGDKPETSQLGYVLDRGAP